MPAVSFKPKKIKYFTIEESDCNGLWEGSHKTTSDIANKS